MEPSTTPDLGNMPKSKKKIIVAVVLVLLALVLVAGSFIVKNKKQAANNNGMGKIIKVNFTAPSGFPEGFPVPTGAVNIDNSTVPTGDSAQLTRLFETKDTPDKVASFYDSYFNGKTHDWSLASTQPKSTPKNKVILAENKSGLVMLVNISPMDSGSLINLIFMKTITTNNQK